MDFSLTRTYVYTVEKEDEIYLKGIKETIDRNARVKIPNLKDADIIREAFHFILDHKNRNLEFTYYTLLGSLFDITPSTSLKIFLNGSEKLADTLEGMSKEEILLIYDIKSDLPVYMKFKHALENMKSIPADQEELWQSMQGLTSGYASFNYMETFFGTWLVSMGIPGNITVISYIAMEAMLMKISDVRFRQLKELFVSMVDMLFDLSGYLDKRHKAI